jgi:hypothetical protein
MPYISNREHCDSEPTKNYKHQELKGSSSNISKEEVKTDGA